MYIFLFTCTYEQNIPHEPFVHTNQVFSNSKPSFPRHPLPDGWNWCRFFSTTKTYLLGTTRMELSWKMKVKPVRCFLGESELELDHFMLCGFAQKHDKKKSDFVKIFAWMWEWMDFMKPSDETSLRNRRVGLCLVEISSLKVWTATWSHVCSPWRPGSC